MVLIIICFEFKYLCKILFVKCSNGARRVPTIFAPDVVFESIAISFKFATDFPKFILTAETYFKAV